MRSGWRRNCEVAWGEARSRRVRGQRVQFLVLAVLVGAATAAADVKLPALISDNMVLQQGRQVAIWGTADAGEQVTVSLGEQQESATADSSGKWKVDLGPLKKGGPLEMTVAGKNTVAVHNVLVGEVWVCSGQSNMEFAVSNSGVFGGVKNAEQEVAAAKPQNDVQGQWVVASPATAGNFSAVGYFFGRDLYRAMKFPVGLIDASWGGTEAEAWTSDEALEADPDLKVAADSWRQRIAEFPQVLEQYEQELAEWEKAAEEADSTAQVAPPMPDGPKDPRSHSWRDAGLWNGMVAPLTPYAIAGAIWYQGESNAGFGYQYRYNKVGLPAPPFRSDDWTVPTQGMVRTEAPKLW